MHTATLFDSLKVLGAVLALAAAFFFCYSVAGYVADSFRVVSAEGGGGCGGCDDDGTIPVEPWEPIYIADGGGGGGGSPTPYCTLDLTRMSLGGYPQQYQYTISWTAPYATSFSINNGIGLVTPPNSGTYTFVSTASSGTYTGTAVTPYGTVTCGDSVTPPEDPPYCDLSAAPMTITSGQSSVLTWNTTKGTSFSINNGVGSLTPVGGGTVTVYPSVTTTYVGTVVGNGGTAQCQTTVTVTPPPPTECKLEITKSANKTTLAPNDTIEYTVTFKNTGKATCTGSGVKLQDVLDPNLTYQSETHTSNVTAGYQSLPVYQSSTRTVSFNAWDVDPNETGWVKIVAKAGTPSACTTQIPNKAQITSYEYNNFGTWVYSNIVTVVIEKDCTPPPPTECKLEITKSANKTTLAPNDTIEYTINVKNIGTKKCTGSGVKVEDVLDTRLTYVSETHSSNITAGYQSLPIYQSSNRTLTWNAWDLDPAETGWITFVAKAGTPTACTETVPNKARITSYEYNNFGTWVYSNIVNVALTKDCYVQVPYCTMSIDPTTSATPGAPATLTWNTTNVTTATINQGVGTVALSGSKVVNPTINTTYTGTFTGPGGTVTCTASITMTHVPAPMCTLSVSASKIKTGQSVIVSWTSQNVTQGSINTIGATTPVSGGSAEVFPADSTTYTGTFSGPYGAVTCSAPVEVEKGTTGCQGNCGGGLNQPNVVMLQKPPEAPLAFVTLEQIPYTGFEAGKALTLVFWVAVGILAAFATYYLMGTQIILFVSGTAVPNNYAAPDTVRARVLPNTLSDERTEVPVSLAPVAPHAHVAPVLVTPQEPVHDLADTLESRAHAAGVLVSPEAVSLLCALSSDQGTVLRQFDVIVHEAVRTLPREDGWVLLTTDRLQALMQDVHKPVTLATPHSTPSVEEILNSVMPPATGVSTVHVEMPMANADEQSVVLSLARAVLAGNRDHAYATVRALETNGAKPASVLTIIAGAYDQLYRARRHGLTTELSTSAITVSDETLATLVETFTHGMDVEYAQPFTALKLAVAQAFEVRA